MLVIISLNLSLFNFETKLSESPIILLKQSSFTIFLTYSL